MNKFIAQQAVEEEITQSYIDYAMSVIISRALPDARDWLKPVLRRILYAMYDMKLLHNAKYKKSAAVVWEVLWKYHPHWDSSVYDAMVRLAQPFSLRYPLVDWQWNFGSIDWDWAAAMRYTEARLTKIAEEMLQDIDLETVDWRDNYDSSRQEPVVLPTKFPNHLCNWTMGIAVWMATNMAPHNLTEIIDTCLLLIENREATIDDIMEIIKGPDFPTGWIIFDSENIKSVYAKWKWSIIARGKVHIENNGKNNTIVIDELPYQVNKSNLVAKIWDLVNSRKIEWITDITDESSKNIIRVTIKLRPEANPDNILIMLYKQTELQSNFSLNNVILIEKWMQPRLLNIKELILEFIDFRREVVYRRSIYLLNKATDRLHILEWLRKAIDIIDEVISTIRNSQTRQDAKINLMNNFEFSDPQAEYILMLRLQTLVWLEIQKIIEEIEDKKKLIEYLQWIINDSKKLDQVVTDELLEIKQTYWDQRKTQVSNDPNIYAMDSSIKNLKRLEELRKENVILRVSNDFEARVLYQSRVNFVPDETYALNYTHNQDKLIVITEKGELVIERLKDLGSHNMKWKAFNFKEEFKLGSEIVFANSITADFDNLIILTNYNNIKKISKETIEKFKKFPTIIMNLEKGEKIIRVLQTLKWDHIWVLSQKWMMVVYNESQIRAMWKTSWWVRAIGLEELDKVANMFVYRWEMFVFVYSKFGWKMVAFEDCKIQKRAQMWLVIADLSDWDVIHGWVAVDDGNFMLQLTWNKLLELNCNSLKLKNRYTKLDKLTDLEIIKVYTPWKDKVVKHSKDSEGELEMEASALVEFKEKPAKYYKKIEEETSTNEQLESENENNN